MSSTERGHRAVHHTADVILEAWAPDLASCCEEAVAALVGTYADTDADRDVDGMAGHRRVHLAAAPPDSLLFDVLEEVIFTLDTADAVPVRAVVESAADGGLDVVVLLADRAGVSGTGSVPKAVSRSEYGVVQRPGEVRCRFLVDV